ncbi:MAG: tetratricopeptide repeat protein [Bryobacteraceae bacterium]
MLSELPLRAALFSLVIVTASQSAETGDFQSRFAEAQALQRADQDLKALAVLEGALPPPPLRDPWKLTKAFSLFRLGRLKPAEKLFSELLNSPDLRAPANFFMANCIFAGGRYAESLPYYAAAVKAGQVPGNRALNAYYYNQGLALYQLHRYQAAGEAFQNSIDTYAQDPLPWLFLGRSKTELGDFAAAIEAYESAIRIRPDFRLAYFQLARLHAEHGDKTRAEELFGKAKELRQQELEEEQLLSRRLKLSGR